MYHEGRKTAVLISLDKETAEIEELADTAGYDILYEVVQKRVRPDPNNYLGKGKLKDLKEIITERPIDLLILNGEAKPSHHYNLESALGIVCVDRVGLILNIFKTRASSREARLQVERARLRYESPLLKEWIHSAKTGEHPGFMGGGEYAIDIYYDLVKKRIKAIDDELKDIRRDSQHRRVQRSRAGVFSISLAGYTNAGKSSLMRALTGEDVLIENRMFSTLSTTTRKLGDVHDRMLVTDTIGFLRNLPHYMIESFRTTLEEIYDADLVLLVVDSSDDALSFFEKVQTSKELLYPKISPDHLIIILNKIDLLLDKNRYSLIDDEIDTIGKVFPGVPIIPCSSISGEGVPRLLENLHRRIKMDILIEVQMPNTSGSQSVLSQLYDSCRISSIDYEKGIHLQAFCHEEDVGRLKKQVESLKGHMSVSDVDE
ncbi:MAG: GTPase HflX [Methanomassiliicoccales archaeon PtaU1.Bin124]|nr:MAG: GTPase HflX [Methanomassiliicoccales archaeon PtaU1.Bin124]